MSVVPISVSPSYRVQNPLRAALRILKYLGIPESENQPSELPESPVYLPIARDGSFDLGDPKAPIGLYRRR